VVLSLRKLMQDPAFNKKEYRRKVSCFKCERDHDIEDFIKKKCLHLEEKNLSRTYLLVEDTEEFILKGFFSIAVKAFYFSNKEDKRIIAYGREEDSFVPAYLIGQLSKCDGQPVGVGEKLLDLALQKIRDSQDIVGGRFVYLDYKKECDKLKKFYQDHRFEFLQNNPKYPQYDQMYIIL